ncbi:MAG TPA: hypothetical protein VIN10_02485 [Bacteroidales bacterium]
MKNLRIQEYCHILNNKVVMNGNVYFESLNSNDLAGFLKEVFKFSGITYPKFYKMDDISKLGFLAAELLLQNNIHKGFQPEEVGLVFSNSQSTLVTDRLFQESINDFQNFYPSPSVFVYTLPNIMLGEISIRHQLRGENAFFIFEKFNADFISEYSNQLFLSKKLKALIGGWVDQSAENYEAFLYFASPSESRLNLEHNAEQMNKLYNFK